MTSKRRVKQISSITAAAIALFAIAAQHFGWFPDAQQAVMQNDPGLYQIDRFIDGDTIAVKMNGATETVRMIGIDTPETHKPNTPVQCYGPAAAAYTKHLIGESSVRLEADPKSQNRDRYKRLLRYVYLPDGRLVAEELLKNGYAFTYPQFPFSKSDGFIADEKVAKAENKGLWGNCAVKTESNGRKQTNNAS